MSSGTKEDRGSREEFHGHQNNREIGITNARKYLLALLASNDCASIRGRIMLVKQMFIIAKEIVPKISEEMHFFPYQWGPYSNVLANEINQMIDEGLLIIQKEGRDLIFQLSESGLQVGNEVLHSLPEDIQRDISNMKETTLDVGLRKFLQYIYTHYPQYAVYSLGKEVYADS